MRVPKVIPLVAPLALVLSTRPARVYAHGGGACRQDIQQFCPDITPGPGAFQAYHQCLDNNAANLSPGCQQQRAEMQAKMQQTLQACQADTRKLCADAGSDPHAIFKCLWQNHDSLSQTCLEQLPHRRHHHHDECHATPTPAS